jgi:MOSC domain-containing protein YiiM
MNNLQLFSVNIGQEETLVRPQKTEQTGIFKRPVSGRVEITPLGIPGDFIGDKKHHGGPDQALYLYGIEDYRWWSEQLNQSIAPGAFGENLTIGGLESAEICVGDRFYIGEQVILEATSPRIPCGTLARRMQIPTFVKDFRHAQRPGIYCRVIQAGFIQAGDVIKHEPFNGEKLSMRAMMHDHYEPNTSPEHIAFFLRLPIAERWRTKKETQA